MTVRDPLIPSGKRQKCQEISGLTSWDRFVISRSGVRVRPPAPLANKRIRYMGEFPSGQRGQTVNLLAPPSVVRIHSPPPEKTPIFLRKSAFFHLEFAFLFSLDKKENPFQMANTKINRAKIFSFLSALLFL